MLQSISSPWPANKLLKAIKFIWSIPTGLISLLTMLIVLTFCRTRLVEIDHGAIDILVEGKLAAYMNEHHWHGFTFGWTIFYWGTVGYKISARVHERIHIKQFSNLGILFPFVYLYYNFTRGYLGNPLELEAYRADGTIK